MSKIRALLKNQHTHTPLTWNKISAFACSEAQEQQQQQEQLRRTQCKYLLLVSLLRGIFIFLTTIHRIRTLH